MIRYSPEAQDALGKEPGLRFDDLDTPTKYAVALGVSGRHIYAGTAPAHVVARRRERNRVARRQRRTNRLRAA